jgi:hypothetical protein
MNATSHVQFERPRRRLASNTPFGRVNRRGRAERETGNGRLREHSRKQEFPMVAPTDCATRLQWACFRQECRWTVYQPCSDTAASR